MSLIICYIGNRGTVIIGDKRRIGFFGDEKKREQLEAELYSGSIKKYGEMLRRAAELDITLKIIDDAQKIREIGEVVVGEVRFKTTFETKRKRIYATTGSYSIVELLGSTIKTMKSGETSIIVFGNKITKEITNEALKKYLTNKISLKAIAEIFKSIIKEVSSNTPTVSKEYDLLVKYPSLNIKQSNELIRNTIIKDVKELEKIRSDLRDQMVNAAKSIEMASKIMEEGEVGRILKIQGNNVEIILNKGVEALDTDWNLKVKSGELVTMTVEKPELVSIGDVAVIENENLCIMRTKCDLKCNVILCKAE
ncbi:MAG: DUF2121 domain-containing protein [Methanobacterium sp.]